MIHKRNTIFFSIILLSTLTFSGCKSNENVSPVIKVKPQVESSEVKILKTYYAKVAKVDSSEVIYDLSTDLFSIKGNYKIAHLELLKYYNNSLTGRIQ